tara:strand:- start:1651 stop:2061 length:411 start_codon:yes stop_codon:yes gene_type:complete
MKKISKNWKPLKNIIVFVNHVELHIHDIYHRLILDCSFENIAKGRCYISIYREKKNKNDKNEINILSDMALMEVKLFVDEKYFKELLESIKVKSTRKPKFKIYPHDGLLVNDDSYLYVSENKKINIKDFELFIPIN